MAFHCAFSCTSAILKHQVVCNAALRFCCVGSELWAEVNITVLRKLMRQSAAVLDSGSI